MSRCKQELMSEDDDTDRVLISSPLTARYRHMATRAVVVVVVWTARDEFSPGGSVCVWTRPLALAACAFRYPADNRRDEEQSNVPRPASTHGPELGPRYRTTAPNCDFSRIDRTWTTPSPMALATRRFRHVRASIGLPASPSPCRCGQTASMVAFYPPSFLAFGLRRRRIGRCRYGPRQDGFATAGS